MDIVATKMTNTIATNVAINCHNKKVRKNLIAMFYTKFY